jgi:hypothetical protein
MIMDRLFLNERETRFYVLSLFPFPPPTTYFNFLSSLCGYKIYACLRDRELFWGKNRIKQSGKAFTLC